MSNPWLDPVIADQQRALVDAQLQATPQPPHFTALANAVRATQCSGMILEVGCGVGHAREILDRAGIGYASFTGMDISPTALALAKERYPESTWTDTMPSGRHDIVIDGCALMHIEDWREHLAKLCKASRRWVVLHRVPLGWSEGDAIAKQGETSRTTTRGYGHEFPAWTFNPADLLAEMKRNGLESVTTRSADGDAQTMTFARPRHFATYSDRNYLGRLKALHASMVRRCGPFVLHVLAWDAEVWDWVLEMSHASVIGQHVEAFLGGYPDLAFDQLPGPTRTRVEHMWTCGPRWIDAAMAAAGEPVTYVDADLMFHSSPEPVFAEIGDAPWALFPHNFAPANAGLPGPTIESHSVFGRFNVGLLYAADRAPIEEWARLCREWCYDRVEAVEAEGGAVPLADRRLRYGDQRFLDDIAADTYRNASEGDFWRRTHVVNHPGADLGPWAIHTRALDVRDGVIYFGNRPLVAYHYSGLRELPDGHSVCTRPEYRLTKRQEDIIYAPYWRALEEARK